MADVRVIRGVQVWGASSQTSTRTAPTDFTAFASTSAGFVRNLNALFGSAYPDATTGSSENGWNIGARVQLTAADTITFTRLSSASSVDTRMSWEGVEYVGTPSGPNEFIVRYVGVISMSGGTGSATAVLSGVGNLNKCVVFPIGFFHDTSGTNRNWHRVTCRFDLTTSGSDNVVRAQRGNTTDAIQVMCAVVEFTGSNWVVENNITHTFSGVGSNEEKAITNVVDTSKAFIVGSFSSSQSAEASVGCNAWFKDSDELYLRRDANASGTGIWIGAVVRNDSLLRVRHYDSITGALSNLPNNQNTVTRSITAVDDLSRSMLICTTNGSTGDNNYPRAFVNYRYSAVDEVEFFIPRQGTTQNITIQAIEFLESAVEIEVPPGELEIEGPAPTIVASDDKVVDVPVGELEIESPVPTIVVTGGQTVTVPTGEMEIEGPAPSVESTNPVVIAVPPGEMEIEGVAPAVFSTVTSEMSSSTVYCERVVEVVMFVLKRKGSSGTDTFYVAHDYWDAGTLYGGNPVIYPVLADFVTSPRRVGRTLGVRHDVTINVYGRSHLNGYDRTFLDLADTHELFGAEVEVRRYFRTHDAITTHNVDPNVRQTLSITGYSWNGDVLRLDCRHSWFEDKELSRRLIPDNFEALEENFQYQYGAIVFGQGGENGVVIDAPYIFERDSTDGTPRADVFIGHTFPGHPMQAVQKVFVRNPLTDVDSRDWLDVGFSASSGTPWFGSVNLSDIGDQPARHLSLYSRGVVVSPGARTRLLSTVMAQIQGPQGYWSASFDGVNDVLYVIDPSGMSPGDRDFDMGGFIRFSTRRVGGIVGKGEEARSDCEWGLLMDNSNQLRFFISTNGTSRTHEVTSSALNADTWYHVRFWHDSAADTINISINNGTPASASTSGAVPFKGDGPLQFGFLSGAGLSNYFHGRMCHWGYWDGITGSTERASIYNSGNGKAYEDLTDGDRVKLVSFWDMSEFNRRRDDDHSSRHLNDAGDVSSAVGRIATSPDPSRGEVRLTVSRARYLPDADSWAPEGSAIVSTAFDLSGLSTVLFFGYPIAFPVNPIVPLSPNGSYFVALEFTNFDAHPYSFRSNYQSVGGHEHFARLNKERGTAWERQVNVRLGMSMHVVAESNGFSATTGAEPFYASFSVSTYTGVYGPATLGFPPPSSGVQYKFGMRGLLDNGSGTYTGSAAASIRNFTDVLRFALMNPDFGRGLSADDIDLPSFNAARAWGHANGVYLSFAIDREFYLSEFVQKLCEQTTTVLYKSRDGRLLLHVPRWHGGQFDHAIDEGRWRDEMRVVSIDDNPGEPIYNDYVINYGVDALNSPKDANFVYKAGSNAFSKSLQINGQEANFDDAYRVARLAESEAKYGKIQFRLDFDLFGPEATDVVLKLLRRIVDRYSFTTMRATIRVPLKDFHAVDLFDTFAVRHTDLPLEGGTTKRLAWTDNGEGIDWYHDGVPITWMKLGRVEGEVISLLEIDQSVEITIETMHPFS